MRTLFRWEVLSEQVSIQSARVLRVIRQRATRTKSRDNPTRLSATPARSRTITNERENKETLKTRERETPRRMKVTFVAKVIGLNSHNIPLIIR